MDHRTKGGEKLEWSEREKTIRVLVNWWANRKVQEVGVNIIVSVVIENVTIRCIKAVYC